MQAAEGLRSMVAAANTLWDIVPLQRDYWFFNFLVEGRGGLEHDHNTVMMTSRWNTLKRDDFINWLSLAAHEYLHVWNVRRMRPAGIEAYDFEQEQYSPSLWIAEGLTSYYDNLLLSRAGLVNAQEYFKLLARDLGDPFKASEARVADALFGPFGFAVAGFRDRMFDLGVRAADLEQHGLDHIRGRRRVLLADAIRFPRIELVAGIAQEAELADQRQR